MKKPVVRVLIALLAVTGTFTFSGCKNSTNSNIPPDAEAITTVDDYTYCVQYDPENESDRIIKVDLKTSRIDTVFSDVKIEHVHLLDNGIIIQSYNSYNLTISPRDLWFLYTPTDILLPIIQECGNVVFSSDHLSTYVYFINNENDADFSYQLKYDSVAYELYYSDLNESSVKKKKDDIEIYASKHQVQNFHWLDGTWRYQDAEIRILFGSKTIIIFLDTEVMYNGDFVIEDNQIVYNRKNGYSSVLDIDYQNKCIGDFSHGVRFVKVN